MRRWKLKGGSLRLRLLLAITGSVVVISSVALVIDLSRERRAGIERITTSLREQASALQAAHTLIADPDVFRRYVEQFCTSMDTYVNPGHCILVLEAAGSNIARSAHHGMPPEVEEALIHRGRSDPVIDTGGHRLISVHLTDPHGHTFILAQYLDYVEGQIHRQVVHRAVWVTATAAAIVFFVYVATARWVLGPLDRLVQAAQRWAGRDFSCRAAVSGPPDLRDVASEFNSMAGQLEIHERRRLLELEQAREIQGNLLPRLPPEWGGLSLVARYRPAGHVAGDLYDVFELGNNRITIAVFDVSGHGLSAAMLTGLVKMSLRRRLADDADLSTAMRGVNHDLCMCTTDSYFVTGAVGIWDLPTGRWTYCAAGHPGGVLVRKGKSVELPSTAPLLGVIPDGQWRTKSVVLLPGDRIFLYTDGLIEARVDDSPFGLRGLRDRLERTRDLDLSTQTQTLIETVVAREADPRADDMTVVALEVRSPIPPCLSRASAESLSRPPACHCERSEAISDPTG